MAREAKRERERAEDAAGFWTMAQEVYEQARRVSRSERDQARELIFQDKQVQKLLALALAADSDHEAAAAALTAARKRYRSGGKDEAGP